MKEEVRLAKARVSAFARTSDDQIGTAASIASSASRDALKMAVNPPSISRVTRNVGAVLLVSPDPFTLVPGAALLGASYAIRSREAASLETLAKETAMCVRTIRELQSFL